jgi:hypothetical protein
MLALQQGSLPRVSPSITAEAAIGANDSVAWNEYGDTISRAGRRHGSMRAGVPDRMCDGFI